MSKKINHITAEDVASFKHTLATHSGYTDAFGEYQRLATKSAIYPGNGTPLGLAYVALKLNGEAGEFAEHIGKAMRDDGLIIIEEEIEYNHDGDERLYNAAYFEPLTPERKALIIKEIGDVLWYLSAACNELGITLSEAALINLQKLHERSMRGTLRGSGDDR